MKRAVYGLLLIFFAARFDLWQLDRLDWWLGLPVGLAYHVIYCALAIGMLGLLVKLCWPAHLDSSPVAEDPGL